MRTLSTCGRCGGTIERRPGSVAGWGHVSETSRNADGHLPVPDDSAVSGPDRDDREPCNACGHPGHDDADGCEEEVSTGLYGSDGVLVYRWCPCTGSVPGLSVPPRPVAPDPWTDPDAAARAVPPPF